MTTVYVVVYSAGGYAREDSDVPAVAGAYTVKAKADLVAKVHYGSRVIPIELDHVHPGYADHLLALGFKL